MTRVIAKDGNLKYALSATDAPVGSVMQVYAPSQIMSGTVEPFPG